MMLMLEMLEYELNGVMTSFKSFDFLCTVATLNLVTIDEASSVNVLIISDHLLSYVDIF